MGDKTKIDWCDATWNPVTGCLHKCEYCYARGIAMRFGLGIIPWRENGLPVLDEPICRDGRIQPYPFDFRPTFHRYRLDIPAKWTKPRTIFVCSMADLFGEWVPDEWIIEVLNACRRAPQHRYLFLTKNPERYGRLKRAEIITANDTNFWFGSTVTAVNQDKLYLHYRLHTFMSCEPMLKPWPIFGQPNELYRGAWPEWVIFGAETGNRKGKVIPKKAWVYNAVKTCRNMGAKVFMKESLRSIMGDNFIQEFPWD